MKFCVRCQFCTKKPVQVGPQQMGMGLFCEHENVREPVTGEPLPCNVGRTNDFCGLKAIYWKELEKTKEPERKVIQLHES